MLNTRNPTQSILLVTPHYNDHGGLERYNHQTVQAFIEAGAEVHALCVFECKRVGSGQFKGTTIYPANRLLQRVFNQVWPGLLDLRLRRLKCRYDLVIAGHLFCLPAALRYARKIKKPCWCLTFGLESWGHLKPAYVESLRSVDRVVTISTFSRNMLEVSSGRTGPIDIIPPMTDPEVFKPENNSGDLGPGEIRLLTVSRLAGRSREKGHEIVLEAMAILRKAGIQKLRYWIAGNGPARGELEDYAQKLGLSDVVHFKGRVPDEDLPALYNACDIFIMPSRVAEHDNGIWTGEGFGIVYTEASACGLPVIACDTGGQTDCVIDGKTGFLIKPDPQSASDAIRRLIEQPGRARAMGMAGRELVQQRFNPDLFKSAWKNLMELEIK
jgi:glycosyltransferase involved in cell wall biosynthesis